jgi:hypothetical protein
VKVANRQEAVVGVPVVVEPIEVEVTLRTIPVEVRHVAVAIDLANGALYKKPSVPPPLECAIIFQKLYRIRDQSCSGLISLSFSHQLSLIFYLSMQHSLESHGLPNSRRKGCGQITQSRDLRFFTCRY